MGYCADTTWNVTFRSEEAIEACLDELDEIVDLSSSMVWSDPPTDEERSPLNILAVFGEYSDGDMEGLRLYGWTGGKLLSYDDEVLAVCAKYADGVVEFRGEEGGLWRVRLKDNTATAHDGKVIYPTDTEDAQ